MPLNKETKPKVFKYIFKKSIGHDKHRIKRPANIQISFFKIL